MFTQIAGDVFTHIADDPREEVGLGRAFPCSRDRRKSKLLVTALAVIGHKESAKGGMGR